MTLLVNLPREAIAQPGWWRVSPPVPVVVVVVKPVRDRPDRGNTLRSAGVDLETGEVALWRQALDALPNGAVNEAGKDGGGSLSYDEWRNVIFGIWHETGGSDDGLELAEDFSARSPKCDLDFLRERVWPYIRDRSEGNAITGRTIMSIAGRTAGWSEPLDADAFNVIGPAVRVNGAVNGSHYPHAGSESSGAGAGEVGAAQAPSEVVRERRGIPEARHLCTDQANAGRLAKAYGGQVLVAAGRWHVWDGRRWAVGEGEGDVYRFACRLSVMVKEEARAVRAKASAPSLELGAMGAGAERAKGVADALEKWSVRCESKGAIEAAVGLLKKMLTVDAGLLDADPWLLNVRNGTVDLRTGRMRDHRSEDLITKLADVDYEVGGAGAEVGTGGQMWEGVLREVVPDADVREFLRRWFGYCATGLVREQVFVVHWGGGANGKSTVLDVVARVLGDYAGTAAPGLLAGGERSERHPTEMADLAGKRMVTAHETREGVSLREDFVKQATGGDRIKARYMREDFFEFAPTHKLQLLTNSKPVVRGQDHGIWRRVRLVSYTARFGSAEDVARGVATGLQDARLMERLMDERVLSGVLGWLVGGAVEWAQVGLTAPAAVLDASLAYQHEQDRVRQFVGECCEVGEGLEEALTMGMGGLYPAYAGWSKDAGYHGLARGRFVHELQRAVPGLQVEAGKTTGESGRRRSILRVRGLRLLPD
jgi:putative DNA primase/helicase